MHLGHPREGSETAPCPGPEGKRGRAEGSINIGRDGHCGSGTAHDLESAEQSHARRQGGRSCPSSGARDVGTRLEKRTHLLRQWGGRAKRGRGRARGHPARGRRSTWPHARHPLAGARAGRLTCSTACSPCHGGGDGAPRSTAARPGSAAVIGRPGAVTWTRRPAGSGLRQRGPLRSCTRSLLPV